MYVCCEFMAGEASCVYVCVLRIQGWCVCCEFRAGEASCVCVCVCCGFRTGEASCVCVANSGLAKHHVSQPDISRRPTGHHRPGYLLPMTHTFGAVTFAKHHTQTAPDLPTKPPPSPLYRIRLAEKFKTLQPAAI